MTIQTACDRCSMVSTDFKDRDGWYTTISRAGSLEGIFDGLMSGKHLCDPCYSAVVQFIKPSYERQAT